MGKKNNRNEIRKKRSLRIRKKISGTSDRPRMTVYKGTNLYVQIIDDSQGKTLASSSSICKELKSQNLTSNKTSATIIGEDIAKKALKIGVKKVVFDRNGYLYTGVVSELADSARKNGLEF